MPSITDALPIHKVTEHIVTIEVYRYMSNPHADSAPGRTHKVKRKVPKFGLIEQSRRFKPPTNTAVRPYALR